MTNKNSEQNNVLVVNAQYIKDCSFENPKAPFSLSMKQEPTLSLDLEININNLEANIYEVVLKIQSKAVIEDEIKFVVSLDYAGVFTIAEEELDSTQKELLLLVECPKVLFPYARRIISDITRDGGYPPLMISPIDFLRLYMQRKESGEVTGSVN